jgi:hypothetical protein
MSQVMVILPIIIIIIKESQNGSEHDHERLFNSKGLGIYKKYIHIKPTHLFLSQNNISEFAIIIILALECQGNVQITSPSRSEAPTPCEKIQVD